MLPRFMRQTVKSLSITRILLALVFLLPFYNEFLSYQLQTLWWSSLPSHTSKSDSELRILLVADPQIQGLQDENPHIGFITRWDADRYLRKTFQLAYRHVKPDVIVFMGDLIDEGSKATEEEYSTYFKRFIDIFGSAAEAKEIFLAGDNDVGGEGADFKEEWKTKRFRKHFIRDKGVNKVKFVDFVRLSYDFGQTLDGHTMKEMDRLASLCTSKYRLLLNHMSVMDRDRHDFQPVLDKFKANLVVSAHTHSASLFTCVDCKSESHNSDRWMGRRYAMEDYNVYTLDLSSADTISEVVVPTCSYRMGVPEMGYGAAVISQDGDMRYTVLWTPPRYTQLYRIEVHVNMAHKYEICQWTAEVKLWKRKVTQALWEGFDGKQHIKCMIHRSMVQ